MYTLSSNFKNNFSYLAAFLAVLLGLSVFKNFASSLVITIFSVRFNVLEISVPFILLMIFAMYLGALALLSENITFRLFPLTKLLETFSYTIAAIGLIYPLLVFFSFLISLLSSDIPKIPPEWLAVIGALLQLSVTILTALRYTRSRLNERYEVKLSELREKVYTNKKPIDQKDTSPYEIVMLYHQFISRSRSILNLKGYGVSGENIGQISKSLISQNILTKKDIKTVQDVRILRNKIVHPDEKISREELLKGRKQLENLNEKLKVSILSLAFPEK